MTSRPQQVCLKLAEGINRRHRQVIHGYMYVYVCVYVCLGIASLPDDLKTTAGVSEIAEGINRRHRQVIHVMNYARIYVGICMGTAIHIHTYIHCMNTFARSLSTFS